MTSAISIRFGGYQPPSSVHHRAAEVFGRVLHDRLGPRVAFELIGNVMDAGHAAADLLAMVEQGSLTMCYFSSSYLAARVPEFALLDLPFLLSDRTHAYAVLDGPLGQRLAAQLHAATGFRLLGFWDNGFRHLSNGIRPIRTPADCQGLRLRTLQSDLHQQVFALLGFEPVFLDVKDLIDSVRAGTIDAQEIL
jgi:TRAP-type transport system periplasmic protein